MGYRLPEWVVQHHQTINRKYYLIGLIQDNASHFKCFLMWHKFSCLIWCCLSFRGVNCFYFYSNWIKVGGLNFLLTIQRERQLAKENQILASYPKQMKWL